jgi:hypothetical protein
MSSAIIFSVIGAITGLLSIVIVIWKAGFQIGDLCRKVSSIETRMCFLERSVKDIEKIALDSSVKIEPLWEIVKTNLPSILNIPHSQNMMEKVRDDNITMDELIHLENEISALIAKHQGDRIKVLTDILGMWLVQVRKEQMRKETKEC